MACKMAPRSPRLVVPVFVLLHTTFAALSHPLPFSNAFRPSITLDPTPDAATKLQQRPGRSIFSRGFRIAKFDTGQDRKVLHGATRSRPQQVKLVAHLELVSRNPSLHPPRHPPHLLKVLTLSQQVQLPICHIS
ncbi:hypothetical protein EDD22DRAFT_915933, partial [Suillus occidentalis]